MRFLEVALISPDKTWCFIVAGNFDWQACSYNTPATSANMQLLTGNCVEVEKAIHWDGRSESGVLVSSGTYFIQLQAGEYLETKKWWS